MLERIWLCDTDLGAAPRPARRRPDARSSSRPASNGSRKEPERRAATLAEAGIDAINLQHPTGTAVSSTLFHRFGRVAFGWDMQFEHDSCDGLRMGLDGVYSDHVDVMVDAIKAEIGSL